MPGKPSRRKRSKYSLQGKRREERLRQPEVPAQQQEGLQIQPTVAPPAGQVAPSARPVTPPVRPASTVRSAKVQPVLAQNPLLGTELRTIGIVAGILLVVLVVLSLVFS